MTEQTPNFSDLEDGSFTAEIQARDRQDSENAARSKGYLEDAATFARKSQPKIKCPACRGSGTFYSKFSGRAVGECFKCKGSGQTTATELKRRATWLRNQPAREQALRDKRQAFAAQHAAVLSYLTSKPHWDFARSLLQQYNDRGSLSENQLAAAHRAMEADQLKAQRIAQSAVERSQVQSTPAATPQPQTGLDLSALPEGLYAVPGGDTRLKVKVQKPEPPSKWAGYVFVSDGAGYGHAKKYGSQRPGGRYQGEIQDALKAILENPQAAMAAYGHLTGRCGICNRLLEDKESVARGIGPICAGKLGWE